MIPHEEDLEGRAREQTERKLGADAAYKPVVSSPGCDDLCWAVMRISAGPVEWVRRTGLIAQTCPPPPPPQPLRTQKDCRELTRDNDTACSGLILDDSWGVSGSNVELNVEIRFGGFVRGDKS